MKVYIVFQKVYVDGGIKWDNVIGVFKSKERAELERRSRNDSYFIEEELVE